MKILGAIAFLMCAESQAQSNDYVGEIERYLNDISTFESDFIQEDKYGRKSTGHFFLKRPFLMKMIYKDPDLPVIIAKDDKVTHYNRELKEKTVTSMYSSPLSFFLERKINLRKNLKVLETKEGDDFVSVKFCKKDEDSEGAITLVFSKNPLTLRKWLLFPTKNNIWEYTEISLLNWKTKHHIPNEEFEKFSR